ncbi:hypothetical protein FPZ12_037185 [Amycolatopsis acidicola]|uniref:AttH domain-containing protein n=1 Tax=Amycolatopsis acidicola TaxID=2596893 RepID=A0A5N0USG9_9PSEU|nr:lipocalin-like domain-containing protein [Amycolatopsis acidicola]KAA9152320.1 hypothetical protein FPZ12_037185 [Amycolatopsis acidicola]
MRIVETWTGPGRRDEVITPLAPEGNAAHLEQHRNAFEHWYFDAHLDDGHIIVGFLQTRELMSRKPGVELHVYAPDGTRREVIRRYPESAVKASRASCDVRIGDNHAVAEFPADGLPVHRLHLAEGDLVFDLTFENEVPGWMPGEGKTTYGDKEYFAWAVGAPRAKVTGTVHIGETKLTASGRGYHDHNWGVGDMKRIIDHWYWGRLYTEDFTLVYAAVLTSPKYQASWATPLMIAHHDKLVLSTGEVDVRPGERKFNGIANRDYPTSLRLSVADQVDLRLDVREIVHAHDLLSDVPVARSPLVKPLVNRFLARPGYFRFRSDFTLSANVDGGAHELTGSTLHEMVALR